MTAARAAQGRRGLSRQEGNGSLSFANGELRGRQVMLSLSTTRIGADKRGCPRVWLEGRRLESAGFKPAARYEISFDEASRTIVLRLAANGDRMVSRRTRGSRDLPVVDIANAKLLESFKGVESLKVVFSDGSVRITPTASELRRIERETRLRERIERGLPLRTGSVSTGLGVLALAMHDGLAASGIQSDLHFSVEIDERYQEHCAQANPTWTDATLAVCAPMQEIAFDADSLRSLPAVEILEAGIPCTAHSAAGRAKKALSMPEDDETAGHLVAGFLAIVAAVNPGVLVVENVPSYARSASFAIMRNQLREWGYDVRDTVLRGQDFGCLEHRERMALVASVPGIDIDLDTIAPPVQEAPRLGDVLDDVPDDSPRWTEMTYLRQKEERDVAAGKGFRMQIFDPESDHVSTIGRGYAKIRSTEPKIRHPRNPKLLRQLNPAEHARIKGIPESMVEGLPDTTAHEMLGQSILAAPFRALGARIGAAVSAWTQGLPAPRGERRRSAPALPPLSDLPLFA